MKTSKVWKMIVATVLMIGILAQAQVTLPFTNAIVFTQRFTQATARVSTTPTTTNAPWVIRLTFDSGALPGWTGTTNNLTVRYSAEASALVTVSNSEIATYNGMTVSNVLASSFFTVQTQAMNAANLKMQDNTAGR